MYTITILDNDSAGLLAVTLLDILELFEPFVREAEWSVSGLEAIGPGSDQLHALELNGVRLDTSQLIVLAGMLEQVIDGEFAAHERGSGTPWLRLQAIDSSSWDIATDRQDLLQRARQTFRVVHEAGEVS